MIELSLSGVMRTSTFAASIAAFVALPAHAQSPQTVLAMSVTESNVQQLPAGSACEISVTDVADGPYNCRIAVTCGGASIYGSGTSGFNACLVDANGGVTINDANFNDGDPGLYFYVVRGQPATARVWTESWQLAMEANRTPPEVPPPASFNGSTSAQSDVGPHTWVLVPNDTFDATTVVGTYLDASFRPIGGRVEWDGALTTIESGPARTLVGASSFRELFTSQDLEIAAGVFGIGRASVGTGSTLRTMVYQKTMAREAVLLPQTVQFRDVPAGAYYYVQGVLSGQSVDVFVRGSTEQVRASVSGSYQAFHMGLSQQASTARIEAATTTHGCEDWIGGGSVRRTV